MPGLRLWGATGIGLVALFVVLAMVDPSASTSGPVFCLFRRATGTPCPACGLTRALHFAAHGRLGESLALHPLLPLVAAEVLVAWLLWGDRLVNGRRRFARWTIPALVLTGALFVALWAGRLVAGTLPE